MGMRKMELTERAYRREAAVASSRQGRKRWRKLGRDQMQMEDEESRPSGGRDGAAKPVVLAQGKYSGPSCYWP